ncbi:MAG: dephospho-CoA kinase [Nitrospirota bacterium]|nr:dephospho-CoA kinase [Nitrospirota bacterium]MDH4359318.1 dephospho-CoA kinase [Nitrospirota bacterium]MDH5297040.1 dephospho-CoA kinase [Nitrospirota bacterium]
MKYSSSLVQYPKGFGRVKRESKFFKIYCRSPHPMLWLGMVVVGLTGGLASGKTTVAGLFKSLGARIIDADQLARTVVEPGKPAWRDILKEFGPQVLNSDKTINRQALANIVFGAPRKLRLLQKIIHPRVAREQAKQAKIIQQRSPYAVIIYDAALLLEAGAQKRMDHVIVVTADRTTQLDRACRRDGLSKTQAIRRIKQQMPLRRKLEYADAVLDGTWARSRLRRAVQSLYRTYANEARQRKTRHRLKTPTTSRRSI